MPLDIQKWLSGAHIGRNIANLFKSFKKGVAKTAVSITEAIKTATEGSIVKTLASFIDGALNTHLAEDARLLINKLALKALAVELAIEGLPDNPTEDDITSFEEDVITVVSGLTPSQSSKLWTTLAAQVYEHIKEALGNDDVITFAEIVNVVEESYQDYIKDKADSESDSL